MGRGRPDRGGRPGRGRSSASSSFADFPPRSGCGVAFQIAVASISQRLSAVMSAAWPTRSTISRVKLPGSGPYMCCSTSAIQSSSLRIRRVRPSRRAAAVMAATAWARVCTGGRKGVLMSTMIGDEHAVVKCDRSLGPRSAQNMPKNTEDNTACRLGGLVRHSVRLESNEF